MPPHCDTRDGPVAKAAQAALGTGTVDSILIWIPKDAEQELRTIFSKAMRARKAGDDARAVADDWFMENAIRLHRAGEGEPYTGMKPAGLPEGPVVPRAEKAIGTGDAQETIDFLLGIVEEELNRRFRTVMGKKGYAPGDIEAGREFVGAFIGWVVYSHHLYEYVKGRDGHTGNREKCGCGGH